jgi:hypothetical protein
MNTMNQPISAFGISGGGRRLRARINLAQAILKRRALTPRLIYYFAFVALVSIHAPHGYAMQLISIHVQMSTDSYVAGFDIDTWDIRVRAVCNIPIGWVIKAGKDISPLGILSGSASGFMTNLNFPQVMKDHDLDDLFLIDDLDHHRRSPTEPPTFVGKITVGEYHRGRAAQDRTVPLTGNEIVLNPAKQCPASRD